MCLIDERLDVKSRYIEGDCLHLIPSQQPLGVVRKELRGPKMKITFLNIYKV